MQYIIKNKIKISITIILLIFYSVHYIIPKYIIEPNHFITLLYRNIKQSNVNLKICNNSNFKFINSEGMQLNGKFQRGVNIKETKGTIILIHGIRGTRCFYDSLAKILNKKGYNTLALDLRGHGESEGTVCTFGAKEKYDIVNAIDQLIEQYNISNKIGIWGQSLGGSVALQALAIDSRLQFGIIESTFSNYETIVHEYIKRLLNINIPILSQYLSKRAAEIGDFPLDEANTSLICPQIKQPVFMAHGTKDKHIPIEYGKDNYKLLSTVNKTFYEVAGANHVNLWNVGGDEYLNSIYSFIENVK